MVHARNRLYDRGSLQARNLSAPVISVGNLSVGGSGKTPFVILLGELLKQHGIAFDVLSRGYGRSTRGVVAVDPGGSAAHFGDEPLLIARRLHCPVVVGESRYKAGLFAENEFGPQIHILDDGFQHRSLARDIDIVLVTPDDVQDALLPAGRLREPLESLQRADIIVLFEPLNPGALPEAGKIIWHVRRGISIADVPSNPLVFCGIARPQRFITQLSDFGIKSARPKIYRDHHRYSAGDARELLDLRDRSHADGFITTEKDAVNLGPQLSELGKVSIAQVTMEVIEPTDPLDTILRMIAGREPQP